MIAVAMLAGCDYTSGVRGIGPVAALEILAEFAPERLSVADDSDAYFEALERFALWYRQEVAGVATVER
jgi:DNA excision repair protein ERCC-5